MQDTKTKEEKFIEQLIKIYGSSNFVVYDKTIEAIYGGGHPEITPFFMYIRACVPADPPLCMAIGIRHSYVL